MNKLLEDEKITALDFYIIMCTLNYDLEQEHKNDSFHVLLLLVEALIHYYQYQNEQSKKKQTFFSAKKFFHSKHIQNHMLSPWILKGIWFCCDKD